MQKFALVIVAAVMVAFVVVVQTQTSEGRGPSSGLTHSQLSQQLSDLQAAVDALVFVFPGDGDDGPPLAYQDTGLTIINLNTGLEWEKKVTSSGCLHCVDDVYTFADATTTWIDAVNAENAGAGYAGFNDWRLANVRELQSIVDYGRSNPSIDPAFGPTAWSTYWSSTEIEFNTLGAWYVLFNIGDVLGTAKSNALRVRAVRGGR
jgi:hypothetical protein